MSEFKHPLMVDNVTEQDVDVLIQFLQQRPLPKFTNGPRVADFERQFADWVGTKHCTMVGSGSTANDLSLLILKHKYPEGGDILVSPLGWISDLSSIIYAGFNPVFCDISLHNLSINIDEIKRKVTDKTRAILAVSILGYNNISDELLRFCRDRNIHLIEDVCESHGATFKNKRLGSFGLMSNFSFYYAHHAVSLSEGGAICTNDDEIFQLSKIFRSHGMTRECSDPEFKRQLEKRYSDLNPNFIFLELSRNGRSQECNAIVASNQLKRLTENCKKRHNNLLMFLSRLDHHKFYTEWDLDGNSNYAFTVLCKVKDLKLRDRIEKAMDDNGIEHRKGMSAGGNLLRQPPLRKRFGDLYKEFPVVDYIHFFGYYIGNWPDLEKEKIIWLTDVLNKA